VRPSTSTYPSSLSLSSFIDPQIKKILVPHDGSEKSDRALRYAIYLSKLSRAELLILNVRDPLHYLIPASASVFYSPRDKLDEINDKKDYLRNNHSTY
jgi:nucleotide-binding universal stress UspA family protein